MKRKDLRLMCISGIFAALVFVVTAYLHIPTYNGYVHIGDAFIFLAACILPTPYAVGVGAMAIYGAYSVVSCIKQMCCEKMHMLTNVVKNKKNKDDDCASACENE